MAPELGILLADAASAELAMSRATSDAQWFLMDDGVRALPALGRLIDHGAEVVVCATDAAILGVEPVSGVRFGSQYDHAAMVRTAARVLAFTGVQVDDHSPRRDDRTVVVRITRQAKAAQALRSAVGYAGGDLRVAVLVEPEAAGILEDPSPQLARALATLRSLDHPIASVSTGEMPARLRWDIEITW